MQIPPVFSRRTDHDPAPNDLARAVRARRARGVPIWDLTQANPTAAGLDVLVPELLAQPAARRYEPDALGLPSAREAIAAEYAREGISVDPARVVVTASTSEAYTYLFKVLCDPDDAVLIPAPSYPLFEFLARGESVRTVSYPLLFDGRGHHYERDLVGDARAAKALVTVAPNHPTGSLLPRHFADDAPLPLVVDEVFGRFPLDEPAPITFAPSLPDTGLVFRLSGLSKQLGLPQLKLSWILVDGAPDLVRSALERLELVADNFLSVASPVQHALPELLALGPAFRAAVVARTQHNLRTLRAAAEGAPISVLRAPAGWTAVVRIPAHDDEALATALVERDGVLTYPGTFFGFGFPALVLSLLAEPESFAVGVEKLRDAFVGPSPLVG